MSLRIIINADDLGASSTVNEAIFQLIKARKITSASILANGPAFDGLRDQILQYPYCSFGIHLNISEFKPLSSNPDLNGVLNADGTLNKDFKRIPKDRNTRKAIYEEWCAQINRVLMLKVPMVHINSHDHVHIRIPYLYPIVKKLQQKYGIRKVRIAKNIYSLDKPIASNCLKIQKVIVNAFYKYYYRTHTTSAFTELMTFIQSCNNIRHNKTIELMVHPGHEGDDFKKETAILDTDWVEKLPFKIRLINYEEL